MNNVIVVHLQCWLVCCCCCFCFVCLSVFNIMAIFYSKINNNNNKGKNFQKWSKSNWIKINKEIYIKWGELLHLSRTHTHTLAKAWLLVNRKMQPMKSCSCFHFISFIHSTHILDNLFKLFPIRLFLYEMCGKKTTSTKKKKKWKQNEIFFDHKKNKTFTT